MKPSILFATLLVSATATIHVPDALSSDLTSICAKPEAHIVATVVEKRTNSLTFCKAVVTTETITSFSTNRDCPLQLKEVLAEGIGLPLKNGHDCDIQAGDEISGTLTRKNGNIAIEF